MNPSVLVLCPLLLLEMVGSASGVFRCRWETFKRQYGKHYLSRAEEELRFSIFKNNIRDLQRQPENANSKNIWHITGINRYTDMTASEPRWKQPKGRTLQERARFAFQYALDAHSMNGSHSGGGWKRKLRPRILSAGALGLGLYTLIQGQTEVKVQKEDIPDLSNPYLDLRDCFGPPRNQGNCGACYAFATVSRNMVEPAVYILNASLAPALIGTIGKEQGHDHRKRRAIERAPTTKLVRAAVGDMRTTPACPPPRSQLSVRKTHAENSYSAGCIEIEQGPDASGKHRHQAYRCGQPHAIRQNNLYAVAVLECGLYKESGKRIELSEQMVIDCTKDANSGCAGGDNAYVFEWLIKNKRMSERNEYPYTGTDTGVCKFKPYSGVPIHITYEWVKEYSEDHLKEALDRFGPVAASMDADPTTFEPFYGSGIYRDRKCSTVRLNHAVVVCGYGTFRGEDYWLIRNSYGTNWGKKGYFKLARNKSNMCGVATRAFVLTSINQDS